MAGDSYGSLSGLADGGPRPVATRARARMFVGVGLLCFIAAAVAVASLHAYNGQSVLMLRPTESQALNELSKSARMLSSADPAKAPKMESAV